jgi:hypothetical protein
MDAVAVRTLVLDVRLSYAPNMVELEKLSDHELAKIILVDGCFLLELLISKGLDSKDSTGFGALSWLSGIFVVNSGKHMDNIPEPKALDFYFKFQNRKLEIKQLHITKTTKAKWCNLIAWEHHQKILCIQTTYRPSSIYSSNSIWAALIFNDLICSADDVQFLKDKKIVVDHVKMSNQELMKFFREIALGIDHRVFDDCIYIRMVEDINDIF